MKRWFVALMSVLSLMIPLIPCPPLTAAPFKATPHQAGVSATAVKPPTRASVGSAAAQPQSGGIWKVIQKSGSNAFGYPPRIVGGDRDFAPPFFDRLFSVGNDGKYKQELALSWDTSRDGKTILFKLRKDVKFHDGTPFNAQAVKANIDNLIPPKETLLSGITSVDVVDDYTVKLTLSDSNNLILYTFATNPVTYMYSPEALKKNGADWAMTHPVGTGPFMLKDYQPNTSLKLTKNPNYWQKGLPYLDEIEMAIVPDPMTQILSFKAGQANAIYSVNEIAAAQLRADGYPVMSVPGSFISMNFDARNSEIFSKRQVRQAIEYAIDKEAICKGAGQGFYTPAYQTVTAESPDYNKACPPRKYDPIKARKLLTEAGYRDGFSFKVFIMDGAWQDSWVAMQSYLAQVGIKMDMSYQALSAYNLIRRTGKIEKGAAAYASNPISANTLYTYDMFWHTPLSSHQYRVLPAGIDELIDKAKSSKNPAEITKINQQIGKLIYDDGTIVPLFHQRRLAVLDKSVQDSGWFIYGDPDNNQFGTRTWLKR